MGLLPGLVIPTEVTFTQYLVGKGQYGRMWDLGEKGYLNRLEPMRVLFADGRPYVNWLEVT